MKISLPKRPSGYRYYPCNLGGRIWQLEWGIFYLVGVGVILAVVIISGSSIEISSSPGGTELTLFQNILLYAVTIIYLVGISLLLVSALSTFVLSAFHRFADIGVGPKGLVAQVYFVFWREVPWADVVEVRQPSLPRIHSYEKTAILVEKLTIWHRSIGLMYAGSAMPTILVTTYHKNWQELLTRLNQYLAEASNGHDCA